MLWLHLSVLNTGIYFNRILSYQNIPSKCGQKWRNMCQYVKERLETRPGTETHPSSEFCASLLHLAVWNIWYRPVLYSAAYSNECMLILFFICLLQQTIKCLLIVPNAESALNEEAGKLLLERYDDYSQRARMMTDIHAKQSKLEYSKLVHSEPDPLQGKKRAGEKVLEKKKKDKKRALKRL